MARSNTGSTSNYLAVSGTPVTAVPATLACWFYAADVTANYNLMGVTTADAATYVALQVGGAVGGDPVRAIQENPPNLGIAVTSTGYTASAWHHACGVFSANNSRAAYLNGGGKGTETTSVPGGYTWADMSVGAFKGSSSSVFSPINGRVAHAAIWSAALGDDEVAALAKGVCPLRVRPQSLVCYWPLYGNGSPEPNYGRNGSTYNLTMNGTMAQADGPPASPLFGSAGRVVLAAPAAGSKAAPPGLFRRNRRFFRSAS